jgi:hypothetical protein
MKKGLVVLTLLFITATLFAQEDPVLIPYRKGNHWGYCTKNKKLVIDCVYNYATIFQNGYAIVRLNNSWNIIDKKGRYILPLEKEYSKIGKSGGAGTYLVESSQKFGLVDTSGKEIFPCLYDKPFEFYFGNIILYKGGKKGIADTSGKMIMPCLYDVIWPSFSGHPPYVAKFDNKWIFIDHNYKTVTTPFESINPFCDGVAAARMNGKWGLIDTVGNLIAPFEYDAILPTSTPNYLTYRKDDKWGCMDKKGKIIFPAKFCGNLTFDSSGIAITKSIDGYYLIDTSGNTIKKLDCENAKTYVCPKGLIEMCKNKKWGVSDVSGKEIIPYSYQELTVYHNQNLVVAKRRDLYGALNKKGEVIVPFKYDQIDYVSENTIRVKKMGLYGLLVNGKKQLDCEYKRMNVYPEYSIAEVILNNYQQCYIGFDGTKYWED